MRFRAPSIVRPAQISSRTSNALLELENLFGLVSHHLQMGRCDNDCRVSVQFAKSTGERLALLVQPHERVKAIDILARWPR